MTANDEHWDDRLRAAFGSQSDGRVDVGAAVLRRVRNRRRWKAAALGAGAAMLVAGVIGWSVMYSNNGEPTNKRAPSELPVVKHEPKRGSLAEAFPPPVEQLDVIGRHQDAFVAVFENWNEGQP